MMKGLAGNIVVLFASLIVLCVWFDGRLVQAQTEQSRTDQARELVEQGRLIEARELLLEEFALHPLPAVAFNLALVQHGLGDYEAAVSLFERLLADGFQTLGSPPLSEARRQRTTELLVASAAELGTVVLEWTGTGTVTWRADGRPRGTVGSGESLRLRLNPGSHVINARTGDGEDYTREIVLARAEVAHVTFSAAELVTDTTNTAPAETPNHPPESGSSISPWPWVVLGTALIPLGTGIVSGLLVGTEVDASRAARDQQEASRHVDAAEQYALVANISYGVAAAVGVAGLIWAIADGTGGDDESDVSVEVGLGYVSLSQRF